MTFAEVKTFFQEHRSDIIIELAGIERHLIDFVDFEDAKEIHIPRLELYVFAEAVKKHVKHTP
ncbi:hypothetical protein EJB10_04410 [Wolbachia endosymbiont of Brugia malayi]|nr:hypothetical protein [Wolbachia endosymbiont of Brugia malayi]QCB61941.1 hypothetical protein EJB10_04410 [Wolbachia endosymbiont of Brugia malayi]